MNENPNPLEQVSVIIVEDQLIVADSLRMFLESLGCVVCGMAPTVERASELVRSTEFEIAILDIDLRGSTVTPVARLLEQLGKRFFFVSGYTDKTILPEDLRAVPRLTKPIDPDELVRTIRTLLGH